MKETSHPDFVETPQVAQITERALGYVRAGFPVHFRGPAGVGKTTVALHVAHRLGRPVMLMVELQRIPEAQDVIGAYEVRLSDDGELMEWRRTGLRRRDDTEWVMDIPASRNPS